MTRAVNTALAGSGGVLQVVSVTKTDTFSSTATSFTDITGLSISITPSNVSSRILVTYNVLTGETGGQFPMLRLVRDSTAIGVGTSVGSRTAVTTSSWATGANNAHTVQSATFLDAPATTSAVTYKIQTLGTSSQTIFVNRNARDDNANYEPRAISTITAMEIAG